MGFPSGADSSGQMGGLPSAAAGLEAQKVEVMGLQEARTQICGPVEGGHGQAHRLPRVRL